MAKINSLICLVNLLSSYEVCLTKPLGNIINRCCAIKVTNLPDWILTFPNAKHIRAVAPRFDKIMIPLIQCEDKQHRINIPEDHRILELSNTTVKTILQLIDRKSKVELNRQLNSATEQKLENIENILKKLIERK